MVALLQAECSGGVRRATGVDVQLFSCASIDIGFRRTSACQHVEEQWKPLVESSAQPDSLLVLLLQAIILG